MFRLRLARRRQERADTDFAGVWADKPKSFGRLSVFLSGESSHPHQIHPSAFSSLSNINTANTTKNIIVWTNILLFLMCPVS